MIRIAVVEDDHDFKEQLLEYLKKCEAEYEECFQITCYKDGDDILLDYHAQFDIILMDIQMKFVDGMTAATEIRRKDSEVIIMFLTSMAQYAVKGYEVDALDYVLKPVDYFTFSQRLYRAVLKIHRKQEMYILVNYKGGTAKLAVSDIFYLENQSHKVVFYGNFLPVDTYGTIKEIKEQFAKMGFAAANSGCMVNLRYVDRIEDGTIWLRDYRIPLSRSKKSEFMEALTDFVGERA